MSAPIYLDYNASTPLDPEVLAVMNQVYQQPQVNAGSISHALGRNSAAIIETAREQIAHSIGAEARDILFCSGATEAINIALHGIARQYTDKGRHIICSSTEHRAVLAVLDELESHGWEITCLEVNASGLIDLQELRAAIRPDTVCCAVMQVNNETGVIQDIQAIADVCVEHEIRFFVDAAQSWGKLTIDARGMAFDALAISSHKNYGPQGIGALYVRRKPRRLRLKSLLQGGGQEKGIRPGTLPVALIAGMGKAAELSLSRMQADRIHNQELRKYALRQLQEFIPEALINGDLESGIPSTLNIQFPGIDAQDLLCSTPAVALAMGSACTSSIPKPSHVLTAMGLDWQAAASSIRMSFGRLTTLVEIQSAVQALAAQIPRAAPVAGDR